MSPLPPVQFQPTPIYQPGLRQTVLPAWANTPPPDPRRATLWESQVNSLAKYPQALGTTFNAIVEGKGSDYDLARLSDVSQTAAVFAIAGLGGLGARFNVGHTLPLCLGALSWLLAMKITPAVVNTAVWLKTGLHLGTHYLTSPMGMTKNGKDIRQVRWLYGDPNYIPQIYNAEAVDWQTQRLGIPLNHPDRETLYDYKIKQIVVQARTLWMLLAGFATPILSSGICDLTEKPLKNWMVHRKADNALKTAHQLLQQDNVSPEKLKAAINTVFKHTLDPGSDMTLLAQWWSSLPKDIIQTIKLNTKALANPAYLAKGEQTEQFQALAQAMYQAIQNPQNMAELRKLLEARKADYLKTLDKPLNELMTAATRKFATDDLFLIQKEDAIWTAKESALTTANHFLGLMDHPPASAAHLAQEMEKKAVSYIEEMLNLAQDPERAVQLAGNNEVIKHILNYQCGIAEKRLGASPKGILMEGLDGMMRRSLWLRRFFYPLTGLMLGGTAIFTLFFLGRDFGKPQPEPKAGGTA